MAYNPFNIFRRNQKVIFAIVTVFIMFTFVLSSGLGGGADFFDWIPRWLGSKGKRGEALATIDGTKIYEGDLSGAGKGLRYQRVMANRYMAMAAQMTAAQLDENANEQLNRPGLMSPEGRRVMDEIIQQQRMFRDPQLAGFAFGFIRDRLRQLATSPTASAGDKEVARSKLYAMMLMGVPAEHYFQNAPNQTQRDLLNFMLWQKKADQMGIRFTADDVKGLVQREFFGAMPSDVPIKRTLQDLPGFSMDAVLKAIGEEFRVRAAQTAALGPDLAHGERGDKTFGGSPVFSPPFEAFEFFKEQASPTTYAVIPVPAANFLDRVPDPNESDPKVREELRNLHRQHKDDEPNPGRETPGFRTPRKVAVGWLSVTGKEPYYVARAEERLRQGEAAAKAGFLIAPPVFGVSPAEVAAGAAPVAAKDALLQAAYRTLVEDEHAFQLRQRWGGAADYSFQAGGMLLDTSVVRPGNLAASSGAMGGQLVGFGNPLVAAAAVGTGPVAYEIRDRVKAGVPAVLAALGSVPRVDGLRVLGFTLGPPPVGPAPLPGPGGWNAVAGAAAGYQMMVPKPLPLDAVRPTLMEDLVARTARRLAAEDVAAFAREVAKLSEGGRAKDKGKAREYVRWFAGLRGLTVHTGAEPRTEWALEEDPGLAPLVKAQKASLEAAGGAHGSAGQGYVPFGRQFFWDTTRPGRTAAQGTYVPTHYPTGQEPTEESLREKPHYLAWRAAEEPSAPRAWSDDPKSPVHADVVAAWKRAKARELAKARAEELAAAIRKSDAPSEYPLLQNLRDAARSFRAEFKADDKAQARAEPFLVRGITPLTTVADPTAGKRELPELLPPTRRGPVRGFQMPESENVKYPTNELARALMDDRKKDPKHVLVLPDAPKDTYYVATLVKREEKSDWEFRNEVLGGGDAGREFGGPTVLRAFQAEAHRKARQSVMGLLKQEFKYEETEEQKKRLDENEKRGEV